MKNLKANTITQQKNQEMRTIDVISCVVFIYNIKIKSLSKKFDENVNCSQSNKINMLKEIYKRLIIPFYIPVLILIPYFLILSSKEQKNYSKLKILTFLIGLVMIILSEGIIRFISVELPKNLVIFISPILIFTTLYTIFLFKLNFKK